MADEKRQIQARVLERVSVLNADKPDVVVLSLRAKDGSATNFVIARAMLKQIAEHLEKHAGNASANANVGQGEPVGNA